MRKRLAILGWPVPPTNRQTLKSMLKQLVRQIGHRVLLSRIAQIPAFQIKTFVTKTDTEYRATLTEAASRL